MDLHGNFMIGYPVEKMRWALCPPGYDKDFFAFIRSTSNGKLMGTGVGVPKKVYINGKTITMVEGNFLCVHKKLREKRLA